MSTETLPRSRVIRLRKVFDAARARGRRISNRHMVLSLLNRDAVAPSETGSVAFLTPKRLGPATVRNRLRRRMREIYRRELARPESPGYLIWIARPSATALAFADLKACMQDLKRRATIK